MGKSNKKIFNNPLISFVVVNYNGGEYLPRCLSSIENAVDNYECIVIDNKSTDNSRKVIKKFNVISILNDSNRGYASAVNQGLKKAKGKYIFLITPTTFIKKDTLGEMIKAINPKYIGIVAPMILNERGDIVQSIRRIPTPILFFLEGVGVSKLFSWIKFIRFWKLPNFDYSSTQYVEQPMSCALLIKKEVFKKIGFFDERFFLYFSDVDFSKRVLPIYRILYLSKAKVIHKRGGISLILGPERIRIRNKDLISYIKKHHPGSLFFLGILIISVGELQFLCAKLVQSLGVGKK
jgi:hypothetical protein